MVKNFNQKRHLKKWKKTHKNEEEVIEKIEEEKKEDEQLFESEYQEKLECPFCMKKYKSQVWLDKHIAKNIKMNPHK